MTISIIYLLSGLVLLLLGAHWLISGAESIARRFHISDIVIGFTIISFGTSAPELLVGVVAALKGAGDITMGNVIGSNVFNLMAVLGITGMILPIKADIKSIKKYIPFSIIVLLLLLFMGNDIMNSNSNVLSRIDGIIMLIIFSGYIYWNIRTKHSDNKPTHPNIHSISIIKAAIFLIVGTAALAIGGELTTRSAVEIARIWNVSEKMIAITIIATGTSLPELITSVIAVLRKKPDIAIGNVIGSNIFNILLVLGVSSILRPIQYNTVLNLDIIIIAIMSIILMGMIGFSKENKLNRINSGILFLSFIAYWVFVIFRK